MFNAKGYHSSSRQNPYRAKKKAALIKRPARPLRTSLEPELFAGRLVEVGPTLITVVSFAGGGVRPPLGSEGGSDEEGPSDEVVEEPDEVVESEEEDDEEEEDELLEGGSEEELEEPEELEDDGGGGGGGEPPPFIRIEEADPLMSP
jgi:hypothetical protein